MNGLTADLGRFLESVTFEQLPQGVLPMVRNGFTDTVGVIMVGITEPIVDIVRRTLADTGGSKHEARVCLSSRYVAAPDAALLGGTARPHRGADAAASNEPRQAMISRSISSSVPWRTSLPLTR